MEHQECVQRIVVNPRVGNYLWHEDNWLGINGLALLAYLGILGVPESDTCTSSFTLTIN